MKRKNLPLALMATAIAAFAAINAYGYFSSLIVVDTTIPFALSLPVLEMSLMSATPSSLIIDESSIASGGAVDAPSEGDEAWNGVIE